MPALLTRPSRPPSPSASIRAAAAAIWLGVGDVEGQRRQPLGAGLAQRLRVGLASRTPAKTRQPAASSRSAVARPMPVEAPVTRTDRTARSLAEAVGA